MRSSAVVLRLLTQSIAKRSEISLTRQLRASIELGILSGELAQASRVPSVRKLSAAVGIAPGTVARAYQELVAEGLLRCEERSGFYVSVPEDAPKPESAAEQHVRLVSLIDEAVRATGCMEPEQFLQLVRARLRGTRLASRRVAVLGYREVAMAERVSVVAEALDDLNVEVVGIAYEDLLATPRTNEIPAADLYLVPVLETQIAAALLGPHASHIVPMTRRLRPDLADFVSGLPPATWFAIISLNRDLIARALVMLRRLHPLQRQPFLATVDEPEKIANAVSRADVLIVGARARPYLAEFDPIRVPVVCFVYIPDERTTAELRSRLAGTASVPGEHVAAKRPWLSSVAAERQQPEGVTRIL